MACRAAPQSPQRICFYFCSACVVPYNGVEGVSLCLLSMQALCPLCGLFCVSGGCKLDPCRTLLLSFTAWFWHTVHVCV